MQLRDFTGLARGLTLEQLCRLDAWLHARIERLKAADLEKVVDSREVVETLEQGRVTYRLERVRCGKGSCKCRAESRHGPYWYAYQTKNGRLVSHYVGKSLPGEVTATNNGQT